MWPTARYVAADKENRRESSRERRRQEGDLRLSLCPSFSALPSPPFLFSSSLNSRGHREKQVSEQGRGGRRGGGKGRDRVQLMFFRCPLSSLLDGLLAFVESMCPRDVDSIGVNCFPIKRIEMIPLFRA